MALVRPRLNDFHGLAFTQAEADFAIPFLDDDIPLYVDPFLLWKSPSMQDQALHTAMVSSFNHFGLNTRQVALSLNISRSSVTNYQSGSKELGYPGLCPKT